MKKTLALLLLCGALSCACDKTEDMASKLDVDAAEITIPSAAGVKQLTITADGPWKMEISEPWVVASKLSGTGNTVVKFAVLANEDYSAREATITITAGSIVKTVTLVQSQLNGIIPDESTKTVTFDEGEYSIPVKTNVSLTAVSDADWLTVTSTRALSSESIPVSYTLNPGREDRTAHVTVSGEGIKEVFTLTQGAFEPSFSVSDDKGVGAWGTLSVPKEGIAYEFTVTTNMDYVASAPDADWIELTQEGGKVSVTIAANAGAARTDYIYMGCTKETVDYSDYGAMIKVSQDGASRAEEVWKKDFYWDIFPDGTRVSQAVAGDYIVLYSPGAVAPGFHLINKVDGSEARVLDSPVSDVTGIGNDDAGHVIVTTGGNYPLEAGVTRIPLKVYVMSQANFLAGYFGNPIIYYNNGFYGYGLDNARVTGDATDDALLVMTSGCGGGGSYVVTWEIKDGAATDAPTAYLSCSSIGGDLWDSFHGVSIGAGKDLTGGLYFAGYLGDYNIHYTAKSDSETSWNVAFETGYTWEGAVNAADVFEYDGHKYMAVVGMNYFAYSSWGLNPCNLWVLNIDTPAEPVTLINQTYYAVTSADYGGWQYGSNTDVTVVKEGDKLVMYLMDCAASTYRKYEIVIEL
jgi:hypothetical protein